MIHRPMFEELDDSNSWCGRSTRVTCTECKDWSITQENAGPVGSTKERLRESYKKMHRANGLVHYWYNESERRKKK